MFQLTGHTGTIHALTFCPGGKTLLSAGQDGAIRLWDLSRGKVEVAFAGHNGAVLCLSLHPDGRTLASGGDDSQPRLWDIWAIKPVETLPKQMARITGLAWIGQRRTLATACGQRLQHGRAGELRLWNFDSRPPVQKLRLEQDGVWSLAAVDGPALAWCGGARSVAVWNLTKQEPKVLKQPASSLRVALSRDGRWLASTCERHVKLWDVERGQEHATLEGHKGMIGALAFSPDGQTLASGGKDKAIRLWPVGGPASIQPRRVFEWPVGAVYSLAFSPDGMLAAAGGDNGTIVVWDLDD